MRNFVGGLSLYRPGLAVILGVVLLWFVAAGVVQAQTKGIGITPAVDELVLEEGQQSARLSVDISNTTDSEVLLQVSTLDFGSLDESGGIAFLGRTGQEVVPRGLSRWMSLDKDTLRVGAGQTETVTVTVENGENLSPGGHYGAIIVSAVAEGLPDKSDTVAVQPAASTLVLLRKRGGEVYELGIDNTKTNKSLVSLPNSTSLTFKNSGNIHAVPRGTVELVSPTGSVLRRGTINEQSAFVLPDSSRIYEVKLTGSPAWLPGRYKLVINWRYDGRETFNQSVEYVWYIGNATLILLIILCFITVLIMYIRYRRRAPTRY